MKTVGAWAARNRRKDKRSKRLAPIANALAMLSVPQIIFFSGRWVNHQAGNSLLSAGNR
ncbi:hypothetical protein BCAR13_520003 [Paraburkholderia caribensis]|nr:hypothetical protein BCAR13_520003 [Paraburkholderia caribensis]